MGSLWWKDIMRLNALLRGITSCSVGMGDSILFWDDLWTDAILAVKYDSMQLHAKNPRISVKKMETKDLSTLFHLPLSPQAYEEFYAMQIQVQQHNYWGEEKDQWSYIWGSNQYSSRRLINLVYSTLQVPAPLTWLWKSKCRP